MIFWDESSAGSRLSERVRRHKVSGSFFLTKPLLNAIINKLYNGDLWGVQAGAQLHDPCGNPLVIADGCCGKEITDAQPLQ